MLDMGDFTSALKQLDKMLLHYPALADYQALVKGIFCFSLNQHNEALRYLDEAISLSNSQIKAHALYHKSRLLQATSRNGEAKIALQQASRLNSTISTLNFPYEKMRHFLQ